MQSDAPSNDSAITTSIPPTTQLAMTQDDNKSTLSSLDSAAIHTPSARGITPLRNVSAPTSHVRNSHEPSPVPMGLSNATTAILARMSAQPASDYSVAREHILSSIVTSDKLPALPIARSGRGRGRPKGSGKRGGANGVAVTDEARAADEVRTGVEAPVTPAAGMVLATGTRRRGKARGSGRGRGGRRTGKRKRADSEVSSLTDSEVEGLEKDSKDDVDSGDASRTPKVTKSGRAVHRPSQFVPVLPSPTTTLSKKRKRVKRNPENAVCKSCERGHSPNNNAIVFCDGCGTPYHQYCHTPPIEKEYIEIQEKEWMCAECAQSVTEPALDLNNLISREDHSEAEKRAILSQLSHTQLVDLLIHTTISQPTIAIFPGPLLHMNGITTHKPETDIELPYDGYETDPPAHYPAPGNGLARTLPPETEDLNWLLDDNSDVFNQVDNYGSVSNAAMSSFSKTPKVDAS